MKMKCCLDHDRKLYLSSILHVLTFVGCLNLALSAVVEETLVAKYSRINADGTWLYRPLFNATLPGPAIECNIGDTLKITVVNEMKKEELSVNWQAFIQTETNHMDGVPYITEYPFRQMEEVAYMSSPQRKQVLSITIQTKSLSKCLFMESSLYVIQRNHSSMMKI